MSLLPSATEIVYSLGLGDQLVGVSHQCDFPPDARRKPTLTSGRTQRAASSAAQIDAAARELAQGHVPHYVLDPDALREAAPDLVLTQDICQACAISAGSAVDVASKALPRQPQFVSLNAATMEGLLQGIEEVGAATGAAARARRLVQAMRGRLDRIVDRIGDAPRPRVFLMEWPDPPWCAGHWMADVARAAGGEDVFARPGEPSRRTTWDEVAATGAEVLAVMPCALDLERALVEASALERRAEIRRLPALRQGRFYALDGTVTSRHGPRVVSVVEALAGVFHPDRCAEWAVPSLIRRVVPPA